VRRESCKGRRSTRGIRRGVGEVGGRSNAGRSWRKRRRVSIGSRAGRRGRSRRGRGRRRGREGGVGSKGRRGCSREDGRGE